ncbi:MAG: twin-arginine translocation signal domain-containing protein, partial [Rubripirellula sp.]
MPEPNEPEPNGSSLCRRMNVPHVQTAKNRRQFLAHSGAGFGALALNGMLAEASETPKQPHHPATAKS